MRNLILAAVIFTFSAVSMASTIGLSNHPFSLQKHVITTEFNNYLTNGAGTGITARYMQRVNEKLNMDFGAGFSNGERSSTFRVGADMMLIPDYGRQPRISIKGFGITEAFDGDRVNSFGAAPTISKGFSFWGKEAFPFLAVPMQVNMNTETSEYETTTALATGITGRIPLAGIDNLVGNIEMNFPIRNSFTSLVFGVSVPLQ